MNMDIKKNLNLDKNMTSKNNNNNSCKDNPVTNIDKLF